ncbi:MAG TPA: TetR/AcrR family transcriptional regulator [Baekduia sp.]|nr:TetR/AcrR family transcriptional regulator [Baekduia sp.]
MEATAKTRSLQTADERREALIVAALRTFSDRGYAATPTTEIAKAAGISQAYLFRLFPTKQELFIAAIGRVRERILATFSTAAHQARNDGTPVLDAMGNGYVELVSNEPWVLRMLVHGSSAAACDPDIAAANRACWKQMVETAQRESQAPDEEIQRFFAMGMLINTLAAMDVRESDESWAKLLCEKPPPSIDN